MGTLTLGEALDAGLSWWQVDLKTERERNLKQQEEAFAKLRARGRIKSDKSNEDLDLFSHCDIHGRYQIREKRVVNGVEEMYSLPSVAGCVKCLRARLSKSNIGAGMDSFGKRFTECRLKNYLIEDGGVVHAGKKEARAAAVEYTKAFIAGDRKNLMLFGMPGNGKSHIAAAIARALIERGSNAMMIKANSFINNYHGAPFDKKDDYVRMFNNVDFLVIDELDKVSKTEASINAIFALIDERDMQMLPTAIISNCTMESIKLIIGVPAFDRLNSGAVKIKFNWESNR